MSQTRDRYQLIVDVVATQMNGMSAVRPRVSGGRRFTTKAPRPRAGHVTRRAPGTANMAAVVAAARYNQVPPRPIFLAVLRFVSSNVDIERKRGRLRRWTGTVVRTTSGGTVAGQTSNSAPDLPAERAHSSPTVDHVQKGIDGAVTQSHYLTDREHFIKFDVVPGVDAHQTYDEVGSPADDESDDDQHRHLDDAAL